jgi:hypothetical protein
MIARHLGIRSVFPTTVRIPDDRFAFIDAYPHKILEIAPVTDDDRRWAAQFLEEWTNKPRRPIFSQLIASPFVFKSYWWEELAAATLRRRQDKNDMTLWPMLPRIRFRARIAFNRIAIGRGGLFHDSKREQRFVLFGLHQQPEASIDVLGAFNSNQEHFIEQLSRLLPSTHELWVKEHKDAMGTRSRGWLKKVARLPNVRLIDPAESTFDLIRRADLVATITGTPAYEAALLGTPAATAGSVFFSDLVSINGDTYPTPRNWPIQDVLENPPDKAAMRARATEYLAWVHAQSFPGRPFDRISVPDASRTNENLDREADAFDRFLAWPKLRLDANV